MGKPGVLDDATDGRTTLDAGVLWGSCSPLRFRLRRIVPEREYTHSIFPSQQRLHTGSTRVHETCGGDELFRWRGRVIPRHEYLLCESDKSHTG